MAQKWNLQDIRPAGKGKPVKKHIPQQKPQQDIAPKHSPQPGSRPRRDPDLGSVHIVNGRSKKRRRVVLAVVIVLVIFGIGFAINAMLGGAEVTVYPKYRDSNIEATFTAHKEPQVGQLGYELLVLEASGERQVSATGQEEVSERAGGTIFIYNEFSESTQRLIKNTRFESPDGLIYRIEESVEIPGRTKDEDGTIVPGVVSATVFADGTGEQYNIGPVRFTVPGLEGTDQYDSIYAESTDSFTGGFEGTKFIIEEDELQTAKQALHLELRDALLSRLSDERPAGFVIYDDAVTFTFETLPATEYGDELATIKERAKLQVPLFAEAEFAQFLAENTIAGYEGEDVHIVDPYTLTFTYASNTTALSDISDVTSLEFDLSGNALIVWDFNESQLKSDLSGLAKTALPSVLSGYPAIERAEAVVRPFWSQSFSEKPEDITITTVVGNPE